MLATQLRTLFTFLVLMTSAASVAATEAEDAIDLLMEKSGLTEQVQSIPLAMKEGMTMAQQQSQAIPDPVFQAMLRSADRAFVTEEILTSLREALNTSLEPAQVEELLEWYNSPLGMEITQVEQENTGVDAQERMMSQADKLLADQQRVKFARKLDKLFGATDMVMDLQQYTGMAVLSALVIANQPNAPVDMTALNRQISNQIEATRPAVEQGIILSLLYSYQGIEMSKLDLYEDFLMEPNTRHFNGVVLDSLNQSLEQGIEEFAKSLANLLGSNLQQS